MKNKETLEEKFCNNCNNDVCCCIIRTQETLEEVAERLLNLNELDSFRDYHYKQELYNAFIVGIKYQQERSYSDEDMKLSYEAGKKRGNSGYSNTDNFRQPNFEEFIEQFKKQ
jgi:hypothetical protein